MLNIVHDIRASCHECLTAIALPPNSDENLYNIIYNIIYNMLYIIYYMLYITYHIYIIYYM